MKKDKKINQKAFTLIELLGVMVIIGIVSVISIVAVSKYFNKSRNQIDEQNKNNVKIAAESYFQANRDLLPKGIGEFSTVDLKDLRKANYLTSDVTNSKDESCMEESYVRVVKLDNEHYSYLVNLYCGDETRPDVYEDVPKPYLVKFEFQGNNGHDSAFSDVKNAKFSFTIHGSETDKNIGIYSYQYMISVKTLNGKSDDDTEYRTVFDSGSIKANSKYEVSIESEKLSKYIDITGQVKVKVDIAVMNDQGGYLNYSSDSESNISNGYEDILPPACGLVSGDTASDDEWTNKASYSSGTTNLGRPRGYPGIVTVKCDDGLGSGCKRPDFSRSWPTVSKNEIGSVDYRYGARWAYIVIEDNAVNTSKKSKDCSDSKLIVDSATNEVKSCTGGNKTVCYVRVNVDIYSPTVNLKVTNPKDGKVVKEITAKDSTEPNTKNPSQTINPGDYAGAVGVDKEEWLNLANYPEGIELEFTAEDQLYLYHWTWETNEAYLPYSTIDSEVTDKDKVTEANAALDGTQVTSGYFDKKGLITGTDKVTNPEQLIANETGPLTGSVTGLKLKLEGKRYGKLTVYDRAGNSTTIHVYANIDRTPPEIPNMTHKKNGAETVKAKYTDKGVEEEKLTYKASGDMYEPAKVDNYQDNNHWSRETLSTYIEGQRIDNKATVNTVYDTEIKGKGDLSGWWKFTYVYEMQDPNKKKYSWFDPVEKDATETLEFKDEGTHKVRIRSCDKAKNCSEYSPDDYLKIDYTLPSCDIKETFSGVRGCTEATTCFNSNCKASSKTCYNENGWLKIGESVVLSHVCDDPNSNISSNCNASSRFNQQTYEYNFDVDTAKAGANGFVNSKDGKSVNNTYINSENFTDEWYNPGTTTAGGHVVDYAGNIQECPVKEVKIDYIVPKCTTKIEYGVDGTIDNSIHPKNPNDESGWLSLYKGGIDGTPGKETATVSTVCEDFKSDGPRMIGVISDCDEKTYKSTVYNWELRTTIAGALGIGQGGEIADLAGNIAQCPADRSINIDYTQPKCNTVIEYPQGGPINQTSVDFESGWLGFNDNKYCNRPATSSSSSGVTVSGSSNKTTTASVSNIKGEGNVVTSTHKAYLSSGIDGFATVTRAEYAKILCDALGVSPVSTYSNMYNDVTNSTNNWGYILAASQQGFFVGIGNHNFSPDTTLTRAQLASSIIRAAAARGVTSTKSCSIQFIDTAGTWYDDDMRAANNSCILVGVGGSQAAGDSNATIAQIATVIYRTFREAEESNCKSSDNKAFDVNNTSFSPSWATAALADATTTHSCTNGVEASGIVQSDGSMEFGAYIDSDAYDYTGYMKRQEFLKLAYDSAQVKPSASFQGKFTDVQNTNNYWPYIEDAAQKGYISGYGNKIFAPNNPITRAEMVTVLIRIMEDNGISTGKTCSSSIPDMAQGQWYSEYMTKAASMCLLVGDQNGFYHATEAATNMEAIAVVYRAFRDQSGATDCVAYDKNGNEIGDYDNVMLEMNGVSKDFWGYEYLKDASIPHTCSGSLVDPNTVNNLYGDLPDTSCNEISTEKKTAVITQICTEQSGSYGIMSGCYGSMKDASSSIETSYQTKTYDTDINTTQGGAVRDGSNGYIVDVAGNITNCDTPENFHTVKIDYGRPLCEVTSKYADRRLNKSGDYDGHWMGANSSATISSFCDRNSESSGGSAPISGCWEEKNTTFTYNFEVKAENMASSVPNFGDAYVYDLAGNRSQNACEKKTVKIDLTGPKCETYARYQKTTGSISASSELTDDYTLDKSYETDWEKGWLNGQYTVRVISYCKQDVATNVKSGNTIGSGCKGMAEETDPSDKKNQRSYADFKAATNTVINGPRGAKPAQGETKDNEDKYVHNAYSVGSGSTITRKSFAEALLKALDIEPAAASHPFTDVSKDDKVVGAVFSNNLMIGTSNTTFSPDKTISRAEMVVAVVRAAQQLGISYPNTCSGSFSDYKSGSGEWYSSYVDYAVTNCILVGFENNTLRASEPASTQQAYTVIDRALRVHDEGYTCTPALTNRKSSPWNAAGDWESTTKHECVRTEKANEKGAKHTIYDNVGNKTECEDLTIKLDNQKPTCTVTPKAASGSFYEGNGAKWTKASSITVSKTCDDGPGTNGESGSGCHDKADAVTQNDICNTQKDSRTYTLSSPNTSNTYSSKEKTWPGYACKDKESSGYVYDNVGNRSEKICDKYSIGIDQEPPTCDIGYDGTVGTWTPNNVTIKSLCTDKGSQCLSSDVNATIRSYSTDTKLYNQNYSYTTHDNVGNSKSCNKSYTVKVDKTAPTGSCRLSGSYNSYSNSVTSSISVTSTSDSIYKGSEDGISTRTGYNSLVNGCVSGSTSYSANTITAYMYVSDGFHEKKIDCSGSISVPGCCSSTSYDSSSGSWSACSRSCGGGTTRCTYSWWYYSNYNGQTCRSGTSSCGSSSCNTSPCSTSTGFIYNVLR